MTGSKALVVAVLVAQLGSCANPAGRLDATSAPEVETMTDDGVTLADLTGRWTGTNKLWFMPKDPVRESDATAEVEVVGRGALTILTYTWSYEGEPQDGALMIRRGQDGVQLVMLDTWHTGSQFMDFRHDPEHEGLVSVHGTYGAGEGPDWGWRITVEAEESDAFVMRMFNITPDGEEAPAVEATFTRVRGG